MSNRRNRKQNNSQPAASAGNEMTVVDGNAVGVAPSGAVADTSTDDAVDAALAAIDAEIAENAEVVALAEVEEVVIDIDPTLAVDTETEADEIEAILAAADAETETTETPPAGSLEEVVENLEAADEEIVAEVIQNDADSLLAELNASDDEGAATTTDATKPARKKKEAAPAAPKRDFHSVAAIDAATLKANLDGTKAIKVIEKAQNLIQSIEVGKKLSRYTKVAVQRLVNDGKVTGKSLVEAFQAEGLSVGTSRAQAQQMTALFQIAGIAAKDATAPKELVLADRGLADELVKLAA